MDRTYSMQKRFAIERILAGRPQDGTTRGERVTDGRVMLNDSEGNSSAKVWTEDEILCVLLRL
jgi:hypothetical protein